MKSQKPLVSVIIPAYNASSYIVETIKSVQTQTYDNLEIIVINDGSTDNTLDLINSLSIEDHRLKIISQDNQGLIVTRNIGITISSGVYIQLLDADDLLSSNKIADQVKSIQEFGDDSIIVCPTIHFFSGDKPELGKMDDPLFLSKYYDDPLRFLINMYGGFDGKGHMIQPNSMLVAKKKYIDIGLGNTELNGCFDAEGELICRLILSSKYIIYTDNCYNYYRKFTNNRSLSSVKTEMSIDKFIVSLKLIYNQLINHSSKSVSLRPYIDLAIYRSLIEQAYHTYLIYPTLHHKIEVFLRDLNYTGSYRLNVGGRLANFLCYLFGYKIIKTVKYIYNKYIVK